MSSISIIREKQPHISNQLLGLSPIDPTIIKDYNQFEEIYRIRHDLIHSLICDARGLDFGEKTLENVLGRAIEKCKRLEYFDLVKNQTPDYLEIKNNQGLLIEISVSRSSQMLSNKVSKYSLLQYFLRINGFNITSEYIIINPDSVYGLRDKLISEHKLNDPTIDAIHNICQKFRELESSIKGTDAGMEYFLQFNKIIETKADPYITSAEISNLYKTLPNKIFHSDQDFQSVLESTEASHLTYSDSIFIESICDEVQKINPTLTKAEPFNKADFYSYFNVESSKLNGKPQMNARSIFPLPYIELKGMDASVRSTQEDRDQCEIIANQMSNSSDPILVSFGISFASHLKFIIDNDTFPFQCRLSQEMKREIALEGPGRKSYARRPDLYPEHHAAQKQHTQYSLHTDFNTSEIYNLSCLFSAKEFQKSQGDIYVETKQLSELSGIGLNYVLLCQSIYREININSLRSDRRRKHILKPTGYRGVFVLIYKGPKLRTGELVSQIWFKIIIDNNVVRSNKDISPQWAFKRLINSSTVSHSHWLSTDAHRLDHYLRCYDKILMGYFSFCQMKFRSSYVIRTNQDPDDNHQINKSLIESMNEDTTNTLGLIILTYMENRRSTSKLLQNVRYLVMASVSIYKYYNSVMSKCQEPIRSPLQLYYLKQMVEYITKMSSYQIAKSTSFGSVKFDTNSKLFLDSMGGSRVLLPRPIITDRHSPDADFAEILSEMYMTMLFNKNQDDPTHSSFQILSKMLEGEESMKKMKDIDHHLGYHKSLNDIEWAKLIIHQPHSHQFSSKAIEIGSKLTRESCGDKTGVDVVIAANRKNLNKPLDEFATYKASANSNNLKYKANQIRQNTRQKCFEAIIPLLEEGHYRAGSVARQYIAHPMNFQVFKKNQIGGVREILILSIISRIKINIIETISRNLCSFDTREILTHGPQKNDLIKQSLYNSRKLPGKRISVFFSLDKSKWGPSFVPCQFLYLFTPFKKQLGVLFPYILSQLMIHQNKKCILPERLIKAWSLDPTNKLQHRNDINLQNLKEKFLDSGNLYFDNESNMGQGILHYTSSYLHSAMVSFRDELYRRLCKRNNLDHNDHFDLFSSDDSFTILSIEILKKRVITIKLDLFIRCQEIAERLFNCTTSKSKSSINPIIGEFNSLFMSNLTFFPTLIKFALASVHPVNTDSFFRMVKESYASSRQIVENGGTLDLYMISNWLNKKFCEDIYHTAPGQHNDLAQFGIRNMPYQLGEYPIFNPSLMLMFGPEFHNYQLYKRYDSLNDTEKRLFSSSHKILKGQLVETMAEMEEGDTMLGGLLRIEAAMGPVSQHSRIKKMAEERIMNREVMESMIINDPLIIFRPPDSLDIVKFKTVHKIMSPGAKEAVKMISSSIYYGRVSATVSAKAFRIPNQEMSMTYSECLNHLIFEESNISNIHNHIKFLYPKWPEYDLFINDKFKPIPYRVRQIMEVQTIRTLSIFKVGTKLNNSIFDVIKFMWDERKVAEHKENQYLRDVQILKTFYPMMKDTIEETLEQFSGEKIDKIKSLIMLLLKLYSLKDRVLKAIVFGPSTSDVRETYLSLVERNTTYSLTHMTSMEDPEVPLYRKSYDDIFLDYNYFVLKALHNLPNENVFDDLSEIEINHMMMDPSIGKKTKKRLFMVLMSLGKIKEVELWSSMTGVILHYWDVRQKYVPSLDKWTGNLDLLLFRGNYRFRIRYNEAFETYSLYKSAFEEPELLFDFLLEISDILKLDINEIVSHVSKGDWIQKDNKVLFSPDNGFHMETMHLPSPIHFEQTSIIIDDSVTTLKDKDNRKIFSVPTGLLNTACSETKNSDFRCYGLSFHKLVKHGCFVRNLDLEYKSIDVIRDLVDDLHVMKPKITIQTQTRLKLRNDWDIRDLKADEEDNNTLEVLREEKQFSLVDDILLLDDDDYEELSKDITWDTDEMMDFIKEFCETDLFNNFQTTLDIQFPKMTLRTIQNLKYDCISSLVTTSGGVNRSTMENISLLLDDGRMDVLYSLISRYDRLYATSGIDSPDQIIIRLDHHLYKIGATPSSRESLFL